MHGTQQRPLFLHVPTQTGLPIAYRLLPVSLTYAWYATTSPISSLVPPKRDRLLPVSLTYAWNATTSPKSFAKCT
jgi:hypothetical protein